MSEDNSDNRAESAIDAVYSLVSMVENLDRRIKVIDSNIKLLNNKFSKFSKLTKPLSGLRASAGTDEGRDSPSNVIMNDEQDDDGPRLVLGNITAFGYIIDSGRKPIDDVLVNIYDESSNLVKDVRTNGDGHWTVRLPPGRYLVKYIMNGFKDIKRDIELTKEIKRYEVK
jgi:hypothetical protein